MTVFTCIPCLLDHPSSPLLHQPPSDLLIASQLSLAPSRAWRQIKLMSTIALTLLSSPFFQFLTVHSDAVYGLHECSSCMYYTQYHNNWFEGMVPFLLFIYEQKWRNYPLYSAHDEVIQTPSCPTCSCITVWLYLPLTERMCGKLSAGK